MRDVRKFSVKGKPDFSGVAVHVAVIRPRMTLRPPRQVLATPTPYGELMRMPITSSGNARFGAGPGKAPWSYPAWMPSS